MCYAQARLLSLRGPPQVQVEGRTPTRQFHSAFPGAGWGTGAHLPIVITVQVATDGQHGAGEAEALGSRCSKGVWRLVNQTGIGEEVEGWGAGARVEWGHLETDRWELSH